MALIKEKYSPNGVNRIYQLLKNEAEKGTAREYDIKVDNLKVVSRNNDPERFFEHEAFLLANSKSITINIYDGSSPRCSRYMLLLTEEEPDKGALSGIDKTISLRMQQERKSWEYDRQKQEIVRLADELADMEKYADKLKDQLNQMAAEKQKMPGKMTEALIALAGAYINRNPNGLSGIPILGNLLGGGLQGQDATEQVINDADNRAEAAEEEVTATFERKKEPEYTGEVTTEDLERLEDALIPVFADEYRDTVLTVLKVMYTNTHIIPEIASLLEDAQQEHGQAA